LNKARSALRPAQNVLRERRDERKKQGEATKFRRDPARQ
jgi:hypothetical protein